MTQNSAAPFTEVTGLRLSKNFAIQTMAEMTTHSAIGAGGGVGVSSGRTGEIMR